MTEVTVRATTLAWSEIRALPRSSVGLGALAIAATFYAILAAFALHGPSAMAEVLLFFWVVAQLVVAILVAARVASARRTRFVESLFTTPLRMRTWLAAQALVGLFLAALVLLLQAPFLAVYTAFVGPPHMLGPVVLAAVLVALFSVAFGLFSGVIVGQSGPAAAAGIAGAFAFLSFVGLVLHTSFAEPSMSPTAQAIVRLTSLSPLALAVDVTGLEVVGDVAKDPWLPLIGYLALTLGLAAAAWLALLRMQSPLGWEKRRGSLLLAALVAVAVATPVLAAPMSFREVDVQPSYMVDPGEHTRIAFVSPGTPIADGPFKPAAVYSWAPLQHGKEAALDILVMVLTDPDEPLTRVEVRVDGPGSMPLVAGGRLTVPDGKPHGTARLEGADGQSTGHERPVYRVPSTFFPRGADAVLGSPHLVEIRTSFVSDGRAMDSHASIILHSDIPGATPTMLAAGAPVPLGAVAALVARRIRTR